MLAKVIASGDTRELARQRLVGALRQLVALGITTNRDHLGRVLQHPKFIDGELHTRFLDAYAADLGPKPGRVEDALAAVLVHDWSALPASRLPSIPRNWRSSRWRNPERRYRVGEDEYALSFTMCGTTWSIGERTVEVHSSSNPIRIEIDGLVQTFQVFSDGDTRFVRTPHGEFCIQCVPEFAPPDVGDVGGGCTAPMPGKVVQVLVSEGDSVEKGQPLVVLEAMKMEQTITAPQDAKVQGVRVQVGDQVDAGSVLVELEE
jgi:acetyl/propionyl-CoA carboxylase alpha subunit